MLDRLHDWALVAHELAGALSPARSAVGLLQKGAADPTAGDVERLLGIASRGLERADRVLQNLQALAAPERHRTRLEPIDAAPLLRRFQSEFGAEAAARGLELEVEIDASLVFPADAHCLDLVLRNLVTNALKFTPRGGRVSLRAFRAEGAVMPGRLVLLGGGFGLVPSFVRLEVRDTGIGLSEEARRRLFEPFYRAPEAEERGVPGSGLGLAVARRLAALLRADLCAGAAPGSGTRFLLTLPADEGTCDLVRRVDAALAEFGLRLRRRQETVAVLRDPEGSDAASADAVAAELQRALAACGAAVHALSATTWAVCAGAGVRQLRAALGAASVYVRGAAWTGGLQVHVQRARRGSSADEQLLQGLVRCRHAFRARRLREAPSGKERDIAMPTGEVSDAPHPSRR